MRFACAIGFGLVLLAGGLANAAQQTQPKAKPTPTPAQCGGKFGVLDTNKDGKISQAEFKGSKKAFAWIDADHNGFLSRPETTRAALAVIGRLSLAEKAHAYRAMDANKDGKISRAEFKGPKARFAMIDANRDGSIVKGEAIRAYRVYVHRALIVTGLKKMDTNKDGAISATEFKGPKAGFARLDGNKDGRIGPGEVARIFSMPMTPRPQALAARSAKMAQPVKQVAVKKAPKIQTTAAKTAKMPQPVKQVAAKKACTKVQTTAAKTAKKPQAAKPAVAAKAPKVKTVAAKMPQPVKQVAAKKACTKIQTTGAKTAAKKPQAAKPAVAAKAPKVKTVAAKMPQPVKQVAAKKACTKIQKTAAKTASAARPVKPVAATKAPNTAKPVNRELVAWGHRLMALDANKDGKLSKVEVIKGIAARFDRIDSNHDRSLTRNEVLAVLAKLHQPVAKASASR